MKLMISGGRVGVHIDLIPDVCPICQFGVNPKFIDGEYCGDMQHAVDLVFLCPKIKCRKMYIATYEFDDHKQYYLLKSLLPRTPKKAVVVKEAQDISSQFAEIYSQAYQAEAYGLGEIAGVGYRKSLEYLIKDYCTLQHPDKDEDIKKRPVSQVIESFVTNENVKQCAKRAIWLGNDETHYVRKWEGKDIKDLKLLIQITVSWIQQEVITKKLLDDMQ